VSNVEDMRYMFGSCRSFNQDLSNWDVSNVKTMESMFKGCESLTKKPNWVVNIETDTDGMFEDTPLEGQELERYDLREANKNVRNTIDLFRHKKFHKIPEDVVRDFIIPQFDPRGATRTMKLIERRRKEKTENKRDEEEPGGGGYTRGRGRGKKRKRTQKRKNKKL
jgi:surface protein